MSFLLEFCPWVLVFSAADVKKKPGLALHSQKTDHYISKYPRLVWRGEKNAVILIDATEIISDIHFIKVLCMCLVTHEMFFGDDDDDDWCHW